MDKTIRILATPSIWMFSMITGQDYNQVLETLVSALNGETSGARATGKVFAVIASVLTVAIVLIILLILLPFFGVKSIVKRGY